MKTIYKLALLIPILYIYSVESFAQSPKDAMYSIPSWKIQLCTSKTTNLIFAQPIMSVDCGSADILSQKVAGAQNILQIKAIKEDFQQTNLSIVTADGKFHSFLVNYHVNPDELNLSFVEPVDQEGIIRFAHGIYNQVELEKTARFVTLSDHHKPFLKKRDFNIHLIIDGVFVKDDLMFFRLRLINKSPLAYEIDQLRFFIQDKTKPKRTAVQEIEIEPIFVHGKFRKVSENSDETMVIVVPKFTIPDSKHLIIQIMEFSGGRHLEKRVQNRHILKAATIY